jgi:O-methyltransferase
MHLMDSRLLRAIPVVFARSGLLVTRYWNSNDRRIRLKRILKVRSERDMFVIPAEAAQLVCALEAVHKIPGDLAEVGVGPGGTAKLIASSAPDRTLHLFDTFEGLPQPGDTDSGRFRTGQYRFELEHVRRYLDGCNVRFHKGLFPATAVSLSDVRFAFVHLDGDLYETTKEGLKWFYPRMTPGGILICHDFTSSEGVNRAFNEFFADKPEPYLELTGCQCMFVKM